MYVHARPALNTAVHFRVRRSALRVEESAENGRSNSRPGEKPGLRMFARSCEGPFIVRVCFVGVVIPHRPRDAPRNRQVAS